jgi:uncharacterized protein
MALNVAKHGVTFEKAIIVFDDPLAISIGDPRHSEDEDRYITIGTSFFSDVLVVSHTFRDERIRIINARPASKAEIRRYMSGTFDQIRDKPTDDDEMRAEYDFSNGVRGKFYQGRGSLVIRVSIDPDVAKHYSTTESVNQALRQLIAEGRAPNPRNE